jgi:hypothetical protein
MDAHQQYDPSRLEDYVAGLGEFSSASFLEGRDIYQALLDRVCDFAGTEHGQIYAYDDETELLTFLAASESCVARCPLPADRNLALGATGHWTDCLRDKRVLCYEPYIPTRAAHEPPSGWCILLGIPLLLDGTRGGLIILGDPLDPTASFLEDLNYFVDRAYSIARGHEAALKRADLSIVRGYYESSPLKVLIDMLTAIGEAVEIRDLYTANHQRNVAMICGHIADQLGLGEFRKAGLIAGASIHDIGKLSVPVELLTKPGKLLTPEWLLIQEHSAAGGSIMHDLSMPWPIQDMILQHHERMDGSGYPNGLRGQEIRLEARIIAVADTYDAMSSDRPYRAAVGAGAALDVLRSGRGVGFDPYVVDAFLACAQQDPSFGGVYRVQASE